jgi:hypothetical protein
MRAGTRFWWIALGFGEGGLEKQRILEVFDGFCETGQEATSIFFLFMFIPHQDQRFRAMGYRL